jgi:hypothetical protein
MFDKWIPKKLAESGCCHAPSRASRCRSATSKANPLGREVGVAEIESSRVIRQANTADASKGFRNDLWRTREDS